MWSYKAFKKFYLIILTVNLNFAAAETIEGILEKNTPYSVLFKTNGELGNFIGYSFKNQSAAGKVILSSCLPGMLCKISQATTRDMENTDTLKFAGDAVGWREIIQAKDVGMDTIILGYKKKFKTRFGIVSIREDGKRLLFKEKPITPTIQGGNNLSIVFNYQIDQSDILLLQKTGGIGCQALFHFVTVSSSGLLITPEFGTCSDIISPSIDIKTDTIIISMNGFLGPAAPEVDKQKVYMTKTIFSFINGQIMKDGQFLTLTP